MFSKVKAKLSKLQDQEQNKAELSDPIMETMSGEEPLVDTNMNKKEAETPIIQYDGISEGYFVGWVTGNVNSIKILVEGVKVAEGICNQSREDVKNELGLEAKGFRILFDGKALDYNWSLLDEVTISCIADGNEVIKNKTVEVSELINEVYYFDNKPIVELKNIILHSSFWNEGYYRLQLNKKRFIVSDLLKDYILFGAHSQKDPSIYFSCDYYLRKNKKELQQSDNPLLHYLTSGIHKNLKPNSSFDLASKKTLNLEESVGYCEYSIIGSSHLIVIGWHVSDDDLTKVSISSQINSSDIFETTKIIRTKRPDVVNAFPGKKVKDFSGFIALFKINISEVFDIEKDLFLNLWDRKGTIEVRSEVAYLASKDRNINCQRVLNNWNPELTEHQILAGEIILPMIQDFYPVDNKVNSVRKNYGEIGVNPSATIIIPLYGRFDFMRYQISNFSRYNCMGEVEVIYIVDDPTIRDEVLKLATELHKTFNFKFSVILLESNVGFGRANNIAAEYASSDNLILLNSDVLPKSGDWAKKLITHLDSLPNAGIVGARLLFEDESIQHDGMSPMLLDQYPSLIFNDHPRKGWPLSLSNNEASPQVCPLVTAACIAIKKALFDELNGFDPAYILGDFEDSDLCLRALAKNKVNYICRDITLNHLERLSQNLVESGDWKHKLTLLNANTYNQRWAGSLKELFPQELKELKNA